MRLFVAIGFNSKTKTKILEVQNKLRGIVQKARFVPQQNFHLTLVFIGSTSEQNIDTAISAIKEIKIVPFEIIFEGVGSFAKIRKKIVWLGIRQSSQLEKVQRELFEKLKEKGFELQKRIFTPHITLARNVIMNTIKKATFEPFSYNIDGISLMQTITTGSGVKYKEIYRENAMAET